MTIAAAKAAATGRNQSRRAARAGRVWSPPPGPPGPLAVRSVAIIAEVIPNRGPWPGHDAGRSTLALGFFRDHGLVLEVLHHLFLHLLHRGRDRDRLSDRLLLLGAAARQRAPQENDAQPDG